MTASDITEPSGGSWRLTLPCLRAEAETVDEALDALCAELDPAPVLSFSEAEPDNDDAWMLEAFFEEKPSAATIKAIQALFPSAAKRKPHVEAVEAQDWVTLSQSGLEPISAGRFHVRNDAGEMPAPDLVNFLIPASRAFGTGHHETTSGCLRMLDRLRASGHRFGNVADIGTGTGLLAFAALALWPRAHIIASDIDPAAVEVTRENLALNDLPEGDDAGELALVVASGTAHAKIDARAPYDLLIANILAGPLIALAPALAAHIADGGSLILAGLLDSQAEAVIAAYRRSGMRLAARIDNGQWPCLHLRKRHRAGWRRPDRWRNDDAAVAPGYGSW
jgi:ribosomal protein L11 methyltransferase